uniref:Alkaline phytoceramidase n=1 Tax=Mucochytrium quahogii TaxID=96639 RepID=A0A7S2SET6_9STRA|mmetsp:Transcript_3224/g.4645  ORF Transcript_3224/g.4645 Transcript_3224/m.4645 type:complete len:283 (+) Transcript_3224:164-1012(+)|eukprot:CAMPEP_0203763272 /NCGR_PEP_ID=MMETSP0098-20131031/15953_1 /ASSEMBLY_ACC=CAM_ASM_000208 /TAXON_ID=96639 /ORGANISM=" , Strain NY0313808BC1" /LENGTH=282 /DNA_ID=CAMNT_0050657941 /DNA_START=43 /DNA_END=891 /DNA_ORIENTATION=+
MVNSGEEDVGVLEALVFGKEYRAPNGTATGYWGVPTGINWCEVDYAWNPYVAEFWNTISSVAFVIAGLAGRRIANRMRLPRRFYALSWSLMFLGLASAMFHCTLLWFNQKLDETFENVALVLVYHSDGSQAVSFVHSILVCLGIFTISAFLFCEIHLIGIIILTLWKVNNWVHTAQLALHGAAGLARAVKVAAGSALIGFICWLIDRIACAQILGLAFNPQLHAWWHIFGGVALYEAFVLAASLYKFREFLADNGSTRELVLPLLRPGVFGLDYPCRYDHVE